MSIDLDWYVVVSEAQREGVAQRALRQIGVATYIPEHGASVRRGRSRVWVQRRLFPGYVFVGLQRGREPWLRIDECSAVVGIVGFGQPPMPFRIEPEVVGNIRLGQFQGRFDDRRPSGARLRPGAPARLPVDDPNLTFAGRTGRVARVISDERIVVMFGCGRASSPDAVVTRALDQIELV